MAGFQLEPDTKFGAEILYSPNLSACSQNKIKLCLTGAQTCALPLFCDRDFEINVLTLKLESNRYFKDVLKICNLKGMT